MLATIALTNREKDERLCPVTKEVVQRAYCCSFNLGKGCRDLKGCWQ